MEYLLHLAIFICFYTLLAQSLNLAAGVTGLISLAHAGFYGIGAYTTALLALHFGFSFWLNLPIALLISGTLALLISLVALRTVEDYFIICTLGIQVIIFSVMNNWMDLTRGPLANSLDVTQWNREVSELLNSGCGYDVDRRVQLFSLRRGGDDYRRCRQLPGLGVRLFVIGFHPASGCFLYRHEMDGCGGVYDPYPVFNLETVGVFRAGA